MAPGAALLAWVTGLLCAWGLGAMGIWQGGVATKPSGTVGPAPRAPVSWGLARVSHSHHWCLQTGPREDGGNPGDLEEEDLRSEPLFLTAAEAGHALGAGPGHVAQGACRSPAQSNKVPLEPTSPSPSRGPPLGPGSRLLGGLRIGGVGAQDLVHQGVLNKA